MLVLILAFAVAACAGPPPADPDALFQDAVALAATPDGTLYVVDAGPGVVVVLRDGRPVARWGGAGTGDGAFLDPVDVDPTNGQAIFVADRAGGVIHQLTAEGRIAVSYPVPDVDASRPLREARQSAARGRPVAVAAAPDGGLYVVDGARRHVLRLSREGDVERVLSGFTDPVDLALDDDGTLWVADAGRGGLQAFDAFGTPGRFRALSLMDDNRIVRMSVSRGRFALVGERSTLGIDFGDLSYGTNGAGYRDGLFYGPRLLFLTATGLAGPALADTGLGPRDVD